VIEFAPPRQLKRSGVTQSESETIQKLAPGCNALASRRLVDWLKSRRLPMQAPHAYAFLGTEIQVARYQRGHPNNSLDASGTSGFVSDNMSVAWLTPAASTQTFGGFSLTMSLLKFNRMIAVGMATLVVVMVAVGQQTCPPSQRRLFGWVRDFQTQRPVRNAAITVEVATGNKRLKSDAEGHYVICLPPGTYRMRIEKKSFARHLVTEIRITDDEDKRVDVDLQRPQRTSDNWTPPNKSLDASGGSVFLNLIRPAILD
jgi:hypothetical protein